MHFRNQDSTTREKVTSLLSSIAGIFLIIWGFLELVRTSTNGANFFTVFAFSLIALGKMVLGVVFLAPSLSRFLLVPFFWVVDLIYCPKDYAARPPLDYRLADYYRITRRFDQAIERYSEIIHYYPAEPLAHARRYSLIDRNFNSQWRLRRAYRKARRCLNRADWEQFLSLIERTGDERYSCHSDATFGGAIAR